MPASKVTERAQQRDLVDAHDPEAQEAALNLQIAQNEDRGRSAFKSGPKAAGTLTIVPKAADGISPDRDDQRDPEALDAALTNRIAVDGGADPASAE